MEASVACPIIGATARRPLSPASASRLPGMDVRGPVRCGMACFQATGEQVERIALKTVSNATKCRYSVHLFLDCTKTPAASPMMQKLTEISLQSIDTSGY
jgi:hypothetical protein